jgi:hypothetical protein
MSAIGAKQTKFTRGEPVAFLSGPGVDDWPSAAVRPSLVCSKATGCDLRTLPKTKADHAEAIITLIDLLNELILVSGYQMH